MQRNAADNILATHAKCVITFCCDKLHSSSASNQPQSSTKYATTNAGDVRFAWQAEHVVVPEMFAMHSRKAVVFGAVHVNSVCVDFGTRWCPTKLYSPF